ncbi:transcriptional regulator [Alsobacter soli]|uniref:Transcriptional regulator n=1 Tax=Alsobacter soli TaxID=2109933 RepID=A0A2T1HRI8_9HYPH|nr:MurR/RpiR family transcriptional regulator [Alsobacter soli]PSC04242.1 transcriptional regulator [Alsobacter soli]
MDGEGRLMTPSLKQRMEQVSGELSPASQRLHRFIAMNMHTIPNMTITATAKGAGVSEPTVARFCQILGFSGFKDFRIELARQTTSSFDFVHADVGPGDKPGAVASKVLDRSIAALVKLKSELDDHALAQAATVLADARRIEFYGHGNSGLVAADAQHKFFRLGIPCISYADSHVHIMAAALLGPRDAVVCISRSGATRELVPTLHLLRERHVPAIGVMPRGSPAAALCSPVIHLDFDDDPNVYSPMSSRLGQLAIVDALAVAVAVLKGPSAAADMKAAKAAIECKKLPLS